MEIEYDLHAEVGRPSCQTKHLVDVTMAIWRRDPQPQPNSIDTGIAQYLQHIGSYTSLVTEYASRHFHLRKYRHVSAGKHVSDCDLWRENRRKYGDENPESARAPSLRL